MKKKKKSKKEPFVDAEKWVFRNFFLQKTMTGSYLIIFCFWAIFRPIQTWFKSYCFDTVSDIGNRV